MTRLLSAVLVALLIVLASWTAVTAISDYGQQSITRLWADNYQGREMACTGFYINRDAGSRMRSYVVSAGHCSNATSAMRDTEGFVLYHIEWHGVVFGHGDIHNRVDVAIGTTLLPETIEPTKRLVLADESPKDGLVWIHGFPLGVERVTVGTVQDPDSVYPGAMIVQMRNTSDVETGSSGSPVLNAYGQVVGIVWGMRTTYDRATGLIVPSGTVLITPVETLHKLFALLEIKRRVPDNG